MRKVFVENKARRGVSLMLVFVLLICFSVSVFADDIALSEVLAHSGSISVTLKSDDFALKNAEVAIYKIGKPVLNNDKLEFVAVDEISGFGSLSESNNADELRKLADYAKTHGIVPIVSKTDAGGNVSFKNLELGAYLVIQTSAVAGFTTCSPFIIYLPTLENGKIIYDVDASPKTDVERLVNISVKKVWNDGGSTHPASVKIRLLNNGKEVETVVLSADNSWSHIWEDLICSDGYTVEELDIPAGYHAAYNNNGLTFTVTNSSKLIQTGQHKLPVLILAMLGLLLFAVGWTVVSTEKKKKNA